MLGDDYFVEKSLIQNLSQLMWNTYVIYISTPVTLDKEENNHISKKLKIDLGSF